jgi:probable F420-dependent oxidoreductase
LCPSGVPDILDPEPDAKEGAPMRLGFSLPQFGVHAARPDRIADFAAEVEQLGADSVWVGDRLLAAVDPVVGYAGGDTIPAEFRSVLDPFALLTVAATATRRVRLGTSVLNLPWYSPAVLARTLSTIDLVSSGRLVPGFGIGWSPEEFEAAGIPWARRAARFEESLDALEAIWTTDPVEFHGAAWSIPRSHIERKPAQRPRPPMYLGGRAEPALRRIGRRADGWLPAGVIPVAFDDEPYLAVFQRQREIIRNAAADAGRGEDPLPVFMRANVLAGTPVSRIVDALGAFERATGVSDVFVDLTYVAPGVDEALEIAGRLLSETGS